MFYFGNEDTACLQLKVNESKIKYFISLINFTWEILELLRIIVKLFRKASTQGEGLIGIEIVGEIKNNLSQPRNPFHKVSRQRKHS